MPAIPYHERTMTQARDDIHRDRHYADDIDNGARNGVPWEAFYAGCQLIVWSKGRQHWTREKYVHDILVSVDTYA